MMRRSKYHIGVLLFLFTACNPQLEKYNYENELSTYFNEAFNHDLSQEIIYYLLPLSNCEPSLSLNLRMLEEDVNNTTIVPILIGSTSDELWQKSIQEIKNKFTLVLEDKDNISRYYELGLGKPLLIHYHNKSDVKYLVVDDQKVIIAQQYLADQKLSPN